MFLKHLARLTHKIDVTKPTDATSGSTPQKCSPTEQRHDIYERIAEGNALAEVEECASRMWNGANVA